MTNAQTTSTPKYVLPADLTFVSAAQTTLFDGGPEENGIVLQRPSARHYPKLVSEELADLVDRFRRPRRLTEAILHYAKAEDLDPHQVLDAAMDPLIDLVNSGFLVPESQKEKGGRTSRFAPDQRLADMCIVKTVRQAADTEVYLACTDTGDLRCVKTLALDVGPHARAAFNDEIQILRETAGDLSPKLISVEEHEGVPVVVTDWIDGLTADQALAQMRDHSPTVLPIMVHKIVQAFANLHARGILHGDIRASNILVDWDQKVWIVDFGLAGRSKAAPSKRSFELSTMEPEAIPDLEAGRLPALTKQGEQYNLALLLAELATGQSMRTLSSLRSEAMQQIAQAPSVNLVQFPALGKATASDPKQRFPSLIDMARALKSRPAPSVSNSSAAPSVLDEVSPKGALDRAYLQFQLACDNKEPTMLAAADRSFRIAQASGFQSLEKASPLQSAPSGACVGLEIALARADFESARHQIEKIAQALAHLPAEAELFTGRAGYLAAVAQSVRRARAYDDAIAALDQPIDDLSQIVTGDLTAMLRGFDAGAPVHLGMAHGIAGLAYALIQANCNAPVVEKALDLLGQCAVETPWGLAWPGTVNAHQKSPRTADYAPGWCAGSAGFLALFLAANRSSPGRYDAQICGARRHALSHPDLSANLCCGAAGRFLVLRSSGVDQDSLSRLQQIARSALRTDCYLEGSLYRGSYGACLVDTWSAQFPI